MKKLATVLFALSAVLSSAQKKWTLREAVDYAVKNNLQVNRNSLQKNIQDKNLQIAQRQWLPGVQGNVDNNASFGQAQDVFGNLRRNDNFNNSANVSANILLYNHGRLDKTIRKTQFDVEASDFDTAATRNNISLQVAQQYLTALLNKEIVKINESAYENAKKLYDRAKITTEVGTTPQTTLAEAQASMARERQNLKNAQVNVGRTLFDLAQLLMLPDYKEFDVEDVTVSAAMMSPYIDAQDVLAKAYENQPEIKAAESRLKSAAAQIEVTKTAFWPTISASAAVGSFYFNSLTTNITGVDANGNLIKEYNFFKQYSNNFGQQLAVTATVPIFNKGITKLQVEQAKINQEIAKSDLEQSRQNIKQNVQKAQFDAEANYETYLAAVEAERSTALALDYAEKSFAAGRTTIYDLNIARNNYANAQGSVAQAKYNYLFSVKVLDFYSGVMLSL